MACARHTPQICQCLVSTICIWQFTPPLSRIGHLYLVGLGIFIWQFGLHNLHLVVPPPPEINHLQLVGLEIFIWQFGVHNLHLVVYPLPPKSIICSWQIWRFSFASSVFTICVWQFMPHTPPPPNPPESIICSWQVWRFSFGSLVFTICIWYFTHSLPPPHHQTTMILSKFSGHGFRLRITKDLPAEDQCTTCKAGIAQSARRSTGYHKVVSSSLRYPTWDCQQTCSIPSG